MKIDVAIYLCVGFFIGGLIGAIFANKVPAPILKKVFGVVMLLISAYMVFGD